MKLFEPIVINGMRLENRIVVPAMVTRLSGEDGFVNQAIRDRYHRYALGQSGLIVVEAMAVHSAKSGPLLRINDDCFIRGLRDLVELIHRSSASKVVPQIIHFLKIARSGWRQKIEELSKAEIKEIVKLYGAAASRAVEAGFDGVELHMTHAYTLSSFLSRLNKRRDEYGGQTLESRMRLMGEVIVRVRQEVGKNFAVGVRFLDFFASVSVLLGQSLPQQAKQQAHASMLGSPKPYTRKDMEDYYRQTGSKMWGSSPRARWLWYGRPQRERTCVSCPRKTCE